MEGIVVPVYYQIITVVGIYALVYLSIYFLRKFDFLNERQRRLVLISFVTLAITTKIVDNIYIVVKDLFGYGIFNIYFSLPFYACDIALIASFVVLILTMKKGKKYPFLNQLIAYALIVNGFFILVVPEGMSGKIEEVRATFNGVFKEDWLNIYKLDNIIVHTLYVVYGLLYAKFFNVFKSSYKGIGKMFIIIAGVTLVVHLINGLFHLAKFPTNYMYTFSLNGVEYVLELFTGGPNTPVYEIGEKLLSAPIIEDYFGSLFISYLEISAIHLVHIIYYNSIKKTGFTNIFYLKMIYPQTTI